MAPLLDAPGAVALGASNSVDKPTAREASTSRAVGYA